MRDAVTQRDKCVIENVLSASLNNNTRVQFESV